MSAKACMVDARTPMDVRPPPVLRVIADDDTTQVPAESGLPDVAPMEVVLACSSADAESIAASAAVLGIPALRVLTGVERSSEALRAAVLRATVPTLFVVCRGGGLEPDRAREAAAAFGSRRVGHHRLLVAQYEPARPGPWMTAVRRAWTSMAAALEVCAGHVDGMLASNRYSVLGGEVRGVAEVAERRVAGAPLVRIAARSQAIADAPLRDRVGTIPAHVRTPGAGQPLSIASTKQTEDDGPAAKSDAVLVRNAVLVRDAVMPPALVAAMPAPAADRWLRAAASAVVALVVVGFAAVPTLGDHGASLPPTASAAAIGEPVREATGGAIGSTTAASATAIAAIPAASPATEVHAPVARSITLAAPPVDVPPSPGATSAGAASAGAASDRGVEASAGPEGRIAVLLVVDGPNVALDWRAAANTCRAREVDGTRGFRLPNIDELRWLRRTGRVRAGRAMWSGSRVIAASDTNWIVDAKGSMARLAKTDTAFTVCVRTH
jgi:hypothetical protein